VRAGRGVPRGFLILAVLVGASVLIPLAYLILRALEAEPTALREIVFRTRNLELLGNTLLLTLGVLVGSSAIALPLAWLVARTDLPGRGLIVLLGVLPLAVPGYVGAYALLGASGSNGLIHALVGLNWPRPTGYWGAVGVLSLFAYPYIFLNLHTALRGLDPSLEETARSLGHSPWMVFRRVVLPQLRPALYAGGLLVGLHALGDFGVVSLMRFETFSYAIYLQYNASFDRVYAAWLCLMLIALTVSCLFLEARLLARLRFSRVGSGAARAMVQIKLKSWVWPALVFIGLIAGATLIVPLGTVVYWLGRGFQPDALNGLLEAFVNSAQASAPAAVIAVCFALPLAYLGVRFPGTLSRLLERVAYLGYATPPLALALALVFFTLRVVPIVYQTLALLVFAYALHFMAEAVGPIRAALYQAPPKLEEAARGLGLSAAQAFWRATFPLISRGVLASLAMVFLSAMKELPITFLLSPIGYTTLARRVWGYTSEAMFAEAAPYALAIVVISAAFVGLVLQERKRES
jgi:iron(III) transport system permease protein